jgi:hypothetical protein
MGDAWTDADGWYYTEFMATGKKTGYSVVWDQDGDGNWAEDALLPDHVKTVEMGGSAGKWAQVDYTVVDPTGYAPPADTLIDGYDSII